MDNRKPVTKQAPTTSENSATTDNPNTMRSSPNSAAEEAQRQAGYARLLFCAESRMRAKSGGTIHDCSKHSDAPAADTTPRPTSYHGQNYGQGF